MMKYLLPFLLLLGIFSSCTPEKQKNILIYSHTNTFRHGSIGTGIEFINEIAIEQGWSVTQTEDSLFFTEENLKSFDVVVWLNTTADVLDYVQEAAFERYIQAGGGYVGIHAASDTEFDWPWYNGLVGAYFKDHPRIQEATLKVVNKDHPSTSFMPDEYSFTDEWYNFHSIQDHIIPLITIDETSYEGGGNGDFHPISWYHEYDGGRAFYTNLGHRNETYADPNFRRHITEALIYAMGTGSRDYSKAVTEQIPDENRFVRDVLLQNLNEPMELDILDDNTVLFIERRGKVREYKVKEREVRDVAQIDVWYGLEEGLLGLAADPNYAENHWVYLYHSIKERPAIQLSRYTFDEGEFDLSSEKILLEVPVMRGDACCHSGGSVEFGPDGLLYLSTGDNTNPFESAGYSPSDEQPGRAAWDAQKSAANTNDLRGKILRIRPLDDGTYEIPEGNLFPPGTEKTRPEIYIMGCRNPFRISLDYKNNWLYWGDVGPDAGKDGMMRGPKGIDELDQAREPGFYGWPYSRGNNIPYYNYNYATKTSNGHFDLVNPINDSPNNTGLTELPPIQESMIWYSYDKSEEFPWVRTGGKNPMAGPIYYSEMYPDTQGGFPEYFDGKVFFYDWIRDWIFLISLDENGMYDHPTPFLSSLRFNNPMDMAFGKDGSLYILEYGESWNTQNLDARLNRISFVEGNRAPIARIETNSVSGSLPLTIDFDGSRSYDFDGDNLKYAWEVDGKFYGGEALSHTFDEAGKYDIKLTVTDLSGDTHSSQIEIIAGNSIPEIQLELSDSSYTDGTSISYQINISDPEDEASGGIDPSGLNVVFKYLPQGEDLAIVGHQITTKPQGLKFMEATDCLACHAIESKVAGPSFREVSEKYSDADMDYLVSKITDGGAGVWGQSAMAAHPQLQEEDIREMVRYILSIENPSLMEDTMLGPEGSLVFDQHPIKSKKGKYVMIVTYQDKGAEGLPKLTSQKTFTFLPKR